MPTADANAKINLFLKVVGRRPDGYHELEMLNVSLDLADRVTVDDAAAEALTVTGDLSEEMQRSVPADERNLAWRAAVKALAARGNSRHVSITLEKHIPVGAGLAGGSADAAAVLRLIGGDERDLYAIAATLGADVPFCLHRSPAIVRGIGEKIEPVRLAKPLHLVLANPGYGVATKDVFETFDRGSAVSSRASVTELAAALAKGDLAAAAPHMRNDLESVVLARHPDLERLRGRILDAGAVAARMTGSGSTMVGYFTSEESASAAAEALRGAAPMVRYCRTLA